MRLICPNCDAEYEVDDAAIPREGRDVQCSACGHGWFQVHPDAEAEAEAEAELYEPPPGAIAPSDGTEAAPDEVGSGASPEEPPEDVAEVAIEEVPEEVPALPAKAARGLDETVLAVLREEAEREAAARRAEGQDRPGLESQTEMPLPEERAPPSVPAVTGEAGSMAAAVKRIARLRGIAEQGEAGGAAEVGAVQVPSEAVAEPPRPQKSRRKDFPAIEEINQSLRAVGDRGLDGGDAVVDTLPEARAGRGAFRRGFVLLVGLAALIVVLYVFAPVIGARVPALAGAAQAYVETVDAGRIWLDGFLRGLISWLQGLAGGQG